MQFAGGTTPRKLGAPKGDVSLGSLIRKSSPQFGEWSTKERENSKASGHLVSIKRAGIQGAEALG